MLADAKKEAENVSAETAARINVIREEAAKASKEAAEARLARAKADGEACLAKAREESASETAALRNAAKPRTEAAADLVIRELIG